MLAAIESQAGIETLREGIAKNLERIEMLAASSGGDDFSLRRLRITLPNPSTGANDRIAAGSVGVLKWTRAALRETEGYPSGGVSPNNVIESVITLGEGRGADHQFSVHSSRLNSDTGELTIIVRNEGQTAESWLGEVAEGATIELDIWLGISAADAGNAPAPDFVVHEDEIEILNGQSGGVVSGQLVAGRYIRIANNTDSVVYVDFRIGGFRAEGGRFAIAANSDGIGLARLSLFNANQVAQNTLSNDAARTISFNIEVYNAATGGARLEAFEIDLPLLRNVADIRRFPWIGGRWLPVAEGGNVSIGAGSSNWSLNLQIPQTGSDWFMLYIGEFADYDANQPEGSRYTMNDRDNFSKPIIFNRRRLLAKPVNDGAGGNPGSIFYCLTGWRAQNWTEGGGGGNRDLNLGHTGTRILTLAKGTGGTTYLWNPTLFQSV